MKAVNGFRRMLTGTIVAIFIAGGVQVVRPDWWHPESWGDITTGGTVAVWVQGNRSTASSYAEMSIDDWGYARVEPWVHGGNNGTGSDQFAMPGMAQAEQFDYNEPWCGAVTAKSNFWHIQGAYWDDYGQHFPSTVGTGTCIE